MTTATAARGPMLTVTLPDEELPEQPAARPEDVAGLRQRALVTVYALYEAEVLGRNRPGLSAAASGAVRAYARAAGIDVLEAMQELVAQSETAYREVGSVPR